VFELKKGTGKGKRENGRRGGELKRGRETCTERGEYSPQTNLFGEEAAGRKESGVQRDRSTETVKRRTQSFSVFREAKKGACRIRFRRRRAGKYWRWARKVASDKSKKRARW